MGGIVVIGGGQAAASLTAKLRALGDDRPITVLCEEPFPPYQRPPLSKAYLLGEMERERLFLRPEAFYTEQDITLLKGCAANAIDRTTQTVHAGDREILYEVLVISTGATPRRLPQAIGGNLDGVHTIRAVRDIDRLEPEIRAGSSALVVGGGYIGLEAAAVLSKKGMTVTLIEAAPRILGRVAAAETADAVRALHARNGVAIREGVSLTRLVGGGRVSTAVLAGGEEIPADLVIAGIGVTPNTALAEAAGLATENGISTDAHGRTSDPAIYAAGDCASFPYQGRRIRLESVQNAIDQAECVARNIAGEDVEYRPFPWFWSDQFDTKLQIAGLGGGHDRIVRRPGDRDGAVSHWYYAGNRLLAVDAIDDPRAYMVGKRLIELGVSPDPDRIGDKETDLKSLLKN